jgi:uncharacterized protein YggE
MLKSLALVTSLSAVLCASIPARAAEFPDYPFVHTSGTGFLFVVPDQGEIDFEIALVDADPEVARQGVEARIADIRRVLASTGLAASEVGIGDVRRDIRKADPAQPGVVQYNLKCGVRIAVSDLAQWKTVMGALIAMPNLDGFLISFDSSKRQQIEADLTADALKQARRRADAIAAGIGRKLGLASAVSTGNLKNVSRTIGLSGVQSVANRSPARNETTQEELLTVVPMKLMQSVDVIYRLK